MSGVASKRDDFVDSPVSNVSVPGNIPVGPSTLNEESTSFAASSSATGNCAGDSTSNPGSTRTWQQSMRDAIRDLDSLCSHLELNPDRIEAFTPSAREFPIFVPREFLARMKPGDPNDPLLLQVLPRNAERDVHSGFLADPVGDSYVERAPGLLHKYSGRVLLVTTGACAIHCRYCFRRHYPYESAPKSLSQWESALQYIADDSSIHEVILSGGDPLTLVDSKLAELLARLDAIPHLSRLRIHTRLPVVIPQRVDGSFLHLLASSRLSKWIVLHINHANEIDAALMNAVDQLRKAGAILLNQTVLLRGVNDNVIELHRLCETLANNGVMPYYLHQLDRVDGASHFEVDTTTGLELHRQLQASLSGYAVPKYVQEIAGQPNKTTL